MIELEYIMLKKKGQPNYPMTFELLDNALYATGKKPNLLDYSVLYSYRVGLTYLLWVRSEALVRGNVN